MGIDYTSSTGHVVGIVSDEFQISFSSLFFNHATDIVVVESLFDHYAVDVDDDFPSPSDRFGNLLSPKFLVSFMSLVVVNI